MMKRYYIFFFFMMCCPLLVIGQLTKEIRGKVIDEEGNYPLFGATVVLKTPNGDLVTGVVTDDFGNFNIQTDVSGKHILTISYIGFTDVDREIQVSGNTRVETVYMSSAVSQLDEVTITGTLEGKVRALNQQRTSDNIKNVISADLIGRFPDLNVAEALQRVSGVNIQRDKGEGSTISIRGTPLNFTTVQINGEQIPSAQQSGARTESLDLISADQLATMVITKAPTPDMDGDAVGGTVNLQTPIAKRLALGVKAESGLGYNHISNGLNGVNKLRLNKRFFASDKVPIGKLGIMVGGSFYESNNSEHRTDGVWDGLPTTTASSEETQFPLTQYQYRITENNRKRTGISATADYKFNQNHNLVFNYMYNQRRDIDERNRFRFDLDESRGARYQTLDSITSARVRRDINIFDEDKVNHTYNLEGNHNLKKWQINWAGFYAISERTFTSDRGDFGSPDRSVTAIADNPIGINAADPNFRLSVNDQDVYNPFLYSNFRRYEEDFETTEATNLVGRIDITKRFQINQHQGFFKFGGKYRTQTNEKFRDNQVFVVNDPNDIVNEEEFFLRSISTNEPTNFLYGDYRFGPVIDQDRFTALINGNRRILNSSDNAWDALRLSLNDTYTAQEDIYAAYAMAKIQFNKLMVLAGLRYETNKVSYDAFEVFRVGTSVESSPISGGNDFEFLLPNFHLKYSLSEYTSLRFSTVFNYARPNFVDVVPFVNQDVDAFTLFLGNPDLQPSNALNIDLMFEHYFKDVGVISIGGFYKDIDKFQFARIEPRLPGDFEGFPGTQGFRFEQEQNGTNAKVVGVEVSFFRSLNFLPGFLKNFNLDANYTYAYSDAFTQDRTDIALAGQAEHTFNTALGFDYKGFSARVSANYNGSFLTSIASTEENDIIQKERLQIDANIALKFLKRWRFYVEGVNLNNEPTIRYQGDESRISRTAFFGWSTRAGISYTL